MSIARKIALPALALLLAGTAPVLAQQPDGALMPFQMVRSLQLVQDRIAGGDHAALPMQKKLLELTDKRFRDAEDAVFDDVRNLRALLIYAMSGGNPTTVAIVMARLEVPDAERLAGAAVMAYLNGDVAKARSTMGKVNPAAFPEELAGFLALVKGSVIGAESARQGIPLLDLARLYGPGTLVEEAALRRTVTLAVESSNSEKFMFAAEQYARRYLRSPYASQYAEALIEGIIVLRASIDLARIEDTISWMSPEQAVTVYLRLARRAAIEGKADLLAFASEKAKAYGDVGLEASNPRSELYSNISSVTSETVDEVVRRLEGLDPSSLSKSDRELLTAARAVAAEVIAPVPAATPEVAAIPTDDPAGAEQATELIIDEDLLVAEDEPEAPAEQAATPASAAPAAAAPDEADTLVISARSKLDAIDKMLEETQ